MKSNKPQPVVVTTICSLCGEPWDAHGAEPDTLDCIRLLKAKVARQPARIWVQPQPYPVYPTYPTYYTTDRIMCGSSSAGNVTSHGVATNMLTPAITANCSAVAS